MSLSHSYFFPLIHFHGLQVGERSKRLTSTLGLSGLKHVLAAQTTIRSGPAAGVLGREHIFLLAILRLSLILTLDLDLSPLQFDLAYPIVNDSMNLKCSHGGRVKLSGCQATT